ncbi:MAG: uroporphyrinogen decarboxylase family protein [Coriobacteriales bacterium]|jgi:hypothetical protein
MKNLRECIADVMGPVASGERLFFPLGGIGENVQRLAGIKSELFYNDVDVNTELACLGAQYYETYPSFSWDIYNFEARALGQPVTVSELGLPDIDYSHPIIKSEDDLDKIKWPTEDPLDAGRYPLFLSQIDVANRYFDFKLQLFPVASSFTLACELVGFPAFMRMVKKQPDLAHEIMRRIVDNIHIPLVKSVSKRWPGIMFKFSDAWEMIPNISPKFQEEFVWKYYDRFLEGAKGCDCVISWYMTYGEGSMPNPEEYLKAKSKYSLGISNVNTEGCPPELYHKVAIETGLPLTVYIPAPLILDGPPDKIVEFTREMARTQRIGVNNFNWLAVCPATASPQNIKAVQAAGDAFGVLPCPKTEADFDKIDVKIPEVKETFGEFCRRMAKENPDGYTFKWLDDARFVDE